MSQKKVGILTLHGYENYGNLLQNYAVQHMWKELGFEPTTLLFRPTNGPFLRTKLRHHAKRFWMMLSKKRRPTFVRYCRFRKFSNQLIPTRAISLHSGKIMQGLSQEYAYFSVGSDQVWNPLFQGAGIEHVYFLPFAERHQRVCFAPSFGLDQLPEKDRQRFVEGLLGFDHLNVREDQGACIIKQLIDGDADVLIDPTMALTRDAWSAFMQDSPLQSTKYILLYFLGKLEESDRLSIKELASQRGLEIIDLMDQDTPYYTALPADFVWLICNSDLVCTDSFHGAVFSIIFNTPFVLFDRHYKKSVDMNSRSATLLAKFGLENRKNDRIEWNQNLFLCSFEKANAIVERERRRFLDAIKKQLTTYDTASR